MRMVRPLLVGATLPVLIILLWWVTSVSSASMFFPPLPHVLTTLREQWFGVQFSTDVLPSLRRFTLGFGIAVVVGVGVGMLLGLLPRLRMAAFPETEFFRATPVAALIPAGLVIIGPGAPMEVALIAFGSMWPILVNTIDGVRSVDPTHVGVARIYGLGYWSRIRRIVVPEAAPQIFVGIEVALPIGLATMVVANMVGASNGIGYSVISDQQSFNIVGTWSGLLLIGLIGITVNVAFVLVRRRILAWHRGWRAVGHD